MSLVRRPVRTTYAHKRGRVLVSNSLPSSPLDDLGQEDLTHIEMSRRMLKRSHCHALSERDLRGPPSVLARMHKRLKPSPDAHTEAPDPNEITIDDIVQFDTNNASRFQTPYPFNNAESDRPTSAGIDAPPEQLSPLPVARRILSRTSSRDLKENSARSSGLASPFHSRPGSVASSPNGKNKSKRRLLSTKSRTLSDKRNQVNLDRDMSLSVTHNTRNPPSSVKASLHNRRPSVPTPTYMLQQITHQDWLVPAKALSRTLTRDIDNYSDHFPPELVIGPSAFLEDFPQAVSTPHRKCVGKNTEHADGIYAPQSGYCSPEMTATSVPAVSEGRYDDTVMVDGTSTTARTPDQRRNLTSCSIVSTIPSYSTSLSADGSPHGIPTGPGHLKLVTLRNYDLAFPHLPGMVPDFGDDNEADSIISPLHSIDYAFQLPSLSASPNSLMSFAPDPDIFVDPSLMVNPEWFHTGDSNFRDPVIATRPTSPQNVQHLSPGRPSSPTSDRLQDLFSILDLRESGRASNSDEASLHDSGISTADFCSRSRSLDSPAEILNKKKAEKRRTRDRRGTIRASDFMKPKDGTNTNNVTASSSNGCRPRRTRSGTVVGPPRMSTSTTKTFAPLASRPLPGRKSVEGSMLNHRELARLSDEDSDDELLLKAHWCDDDWVPVNDKMTTSVDGFRGPLLARRGEFDSDDDLLLKMA